MPLVLPAAVDHVAVSGKARGDVIYIDSKGRRKLATVYGENVTEMRRNRWDVVQLLAAAYVPLWCEEGNKLMTPCMRSALRVLRVLGKGDFATLTPKSTIRAMVRRGIIDNELNICRCESGTTAD